MSADLLARLMAAGTPMDLIGEVAMALATAQADATAIKTRRARDAARKQGQRDREKAGASRDITGRHKTSRDVADAAPLDKKGPQTPKEIN
ncbi:hypothetical protein OMP43_21810, partial [Sphingomonas sp. CBMAI 2297]|uniref:hypothetical protein n=1 Tax=Sphingomonas sp. CBMAI 2297 TaxID=2991720 RepID=UPI002456F9FB